MCRGSADGGGGDDSGGDQITVGVDGGARADGGVGRSGGGHCYV